MQSNFDDVGDFHQKFGLDNTTHLLAGPRDVPLQGELIQFRMKFLQEELAEFEEGMAEGDLAKMADALVDLAYVAFGTAHVLGLPWQALWDDVQRANMTKERAAADGSNSLRNSSFDVIKPAGWRPPETQRVLEDHGFDLDSDNV